MFSAINPPAMTGPRLAIWLIRHMTNNQRLLSVSFELFGSGQVGEGFRVPAGVRKPLMQEPAGHSRWLWGFRSATDVGDGVTAALKRGGGCGGGPLLCLRAVQPISHEARCDAVGSDIDDGRAWVRCRRGSVCGCRLDQVMPGHGSHSRCVADAHGGPRGCLHRSVLACLDVTAERRGTAMLDRRHHLELGEAQAPGMGGPIGGPGCAEDIGDLDRGAHGSAGWRLALHQRHQAVERSSDSVDRPGRDLA